MSLIGKGMMIWQIRHCESGDASQIASAAINAGLTHVLIKIADGTNPYNLDPYTGGDLVPSVVQSLRANGLQVWGWHYVYGDTPTEEAQMAIQRVNQFSLDGYVIDAEIEFKAPGMDVNASQFMDVLRNGLPSTPIALCSFRWPSYHSDFPWQSFLPKCDINMPQVYWVGADNPGAQLRKSVTEFTNMTPSLPVMPTGPLCREGDWQPTTNELIEFMDTSRELNLSSCNYFTWDYRASLPDLWNTIAAYHWGPPPTPLEYPGIIIASLNSHDPTIAVNLYKPDAIYVNPSRTVQGKQAIKDWYTQFLTGILPNGLFRLLQVFTQADAIGFIWQAESPGGIVKWGKDTLAITNNQISYHFSSYTITPP